VARAGRRFLLRPTRPRYLRAPVPPVLYIAADGATATITWDAGVGTGLLGPIVASGATATVSWDAGVPTISMVTGAILVPGLTATVGFASASGAPTLSAGPIVATGVTASVFMGANAGALLIGTYVPGDLRLAPIDMTGLTGSMTISFLGYTAGPDDPPSPYTLVSGWLRYAPPGPGTLTVNLPPFDVYLYIWEEGNDDPAQFDFGLYDADDDNDGGVSTFDYPVSSPIILMWGPSWDDPGNPTQTYTISWSFAADTDADAMSMDVVPGVVDQTPTSVVVYIVGCPPSSPITVSVSGYPGTSTVVTSDSAGIVSGASVAIPAIPVGTAILVADSGTNLATAGLSVLNPPPGRPTDQVADAAPGLVAQTGVVKWVLFDPAPGGTTYTFPINPTTWTSPHAPKNVLVESTAAGNPVVWQGATRSHQFTFSGYLDAQADYEALEEFRDLNHRHWLVDHRNRAWVVSIDAIDWSPKRVVGKPWAYNYTVRAQVYKGPVTL
jgi:hypothetical protein